MIIVLRRVLSASVVVESHVVSEIERGLLLYVCLSISDNKEEIHRFVKKILNLRIFSHHNKESSVKDINGEILSVSQFTLLANMKKGNKPSYSNAMPSQEAKGLFDYFNDCLKKESGLNIATGVFGADMFVSSVDDGPFTLILS